MFILEIKTLTRLLNTVSMATWTWFRFPASNVMRIRTATASRLCYFYEEKNEQSSYLSFFDNKNKELLTHLVGLNFNGKCNDLILINQFQLNLYHKFAHM